MFDEDNTRVHTEYTHTPTRGVGTYTLSVTLSLGLNFTKIALLKRDRMAIFFFSKIQQRTRIAPFRVYVYNFDKFKPKGMFRIRYFSLPTMRMGFRKPMFVSPKNQIL